MQSFGLLGHFDYEIWHYLEYAFFFFKKKVYLEGKFWKWRFFFQREIEFECEGEFPLRSPNTVATWISISVRNLMSLTEQSIKCNPKSC